MEKTPRGRYILGLAIALMFLMTGLVNAESVLVKKEYRADFTNKEVPVWLDKDNMTVDTYKHLFSTVGMYDYPDANDMALGWNATPTGYPIFIFRWATIDFKNLTEIHNTKLVNMSFSRKTAFTISRTNNTLPPPPTRSDVNQVSYLNENTCDSSMRISISCGDDREIILTFVIEGKANENRTIVYLTIDWVKNGNAYKTMTIKDYYLKMNYSSNNTVFAYTNVKIGISNLWGEAYMHPVFNTSYKMTNSTGSYNFNWLINSSKAIDLDTMFKNITKVSIGIGSYIQPTKVAYTIDNLDISYYIVKNVKKNLTWIYIMVGLIAVATVSGVIYLWRRYKEVGV